MSVFPGSAGPSTGLRTGPSIGLRTSPSTGLRAGHRPVAAGAVRPLEGAASAAPRPRGSAALHCAIAVALLALAAGCATKRTSFDELGAKDTGLTDVAGYSVPLDLREFEVDTAEGGYRGVFLKLSRLPSAVTATSEKNPARIILDIQGPTGAESPWETFPGGDTLVTHVGISRYMGGLRVVLDLATDELPEYAVYPMADWVLVRIKPASLPHKPWAHRAS